MSEDRKPTFSGSFRQFILILIIILIGAAYQSMGAGAKLFTTVEEQRTVVLTSGLYFGFLIGFLILFMHLYYHYRSGSGFDE